MALILTLLAVFLVLGLVEAMLTENEKYGWATLCLAATLVAVQIFHLANVVALIHDHVWMTVQLTGGWFAAGIVWSFVRWILFLYSFGSEVIEARERWFARMKFSSASLTPETESNLRDYLARSNPSSKFYPNRMGMIPQASENKGRITGWIVFWPFSILGWALNEPLARITNWIWLHLKGTYQRVADYIFRDLKGSK